MEIEKNAPASGFCQEDFEPWSTNIIDLVDTNNDCMEADRNISLEELLLHDGQLQPHGEEDEVNFNPVNNHNTQNHSAPKARPNLSNDKRTQIAIDILKVSDKSYNVPKGHFKKISAQYEVGRSTVYRIWKLALNSITKDAILDVKNKKKGSCGRKLRQWDEEELKSIPQQQRTILRQFAGALGVSPATVYKLMKKGIIRSYTSSIKPTLKEHHKISRLQFILNKIIPRSIRCAPRFECLFNLIHKDEKWFMGSKTTQRYYLTTQEIEPYRHTQSKNFIEKVMFIAAIARPVFGSNNEFLFDGKIGIWPFTQEHVARRTTANQRAGDITVKPITSITKEVIRDKIVSCLIPAIKEKWPTWATKCIWVQQDNARPHIAPNDPLFLEVANSDGFNINLTYQPAQSPDLNCLDLGFFNAIQAIQHKKFPKNVNELINAVQDAYSEYEPQKINFNWLQLQKVMVEILKCQGGNNYKMPHMGKEKLQRQSQLPVTIEVPQQLFDNTIQHLNEVSQ